MPGNFFFVFVVHTLDLGKAFSVWGLCPLPPTRGVAWFVPWKKALKNNRVFLSGYLKQDKVPGLRALTLSVDVIPRPHGGGGRGASAAYGPPLSGSLTFLQSHL